MGVFAVVFLNSYLFFPIIMILRGEMILNTFPRKDSFYSLIYFILDTKTDGVFP